MNNRREINMLAVEIIEGTHELGSYKTKNKNVEKIYELSLPIELNENQQIVLEWVKNAAWSEGSLLSALNSLGTLSSHDDLKERYGEVNTAYCLLTRKQEAEVLQAFAEWGVGHERN